MRELYQKIKNIPDKIFFHVWKKIVNKYVHNSFSRTWVFLFDLMIVLVGFLLTFILYNPYVPQHEPHIRYMYAYILMLLAVYSISFLVSNSFKGMLRYSGFGDVRRLLLASFLSVVLAFSIRGIFILKYGSIAATFFPQIPEIISEILTIFFLLVISRLFVRRVFNEYTDKKPMDGKTRVIIFGAGSGGILTNNIISQDNESEYKVVAFVDDNFKKAGSEIQGIPVLLPSKVMRDSFIQRHQVKVLIIAIPSMGVDAKNRLAEQALELGLKVKILPHVYELIEGKETGNMKANQIKDIRIEDLLGRDPIVLENEDIADLLRKRVVLVTGAAGSIGSEIVRQVINYEPSLLVVLDIAESPTYDIQTELKSAYPEMFPKIAFEVADVRDRERMQAVFEKYHPEVVFHAAAYKHVPLMEEEPYEAVSVNVFGTKNVADLSMQYGVHKMVMISTDKAVNPTNVMGATKRMAEIYVQSRRSDTQFITTRFGNVLGSNGSVVPLFYKQLEKGGPLTITDKRITRFFMTIPEACNLVLQAGTIGKGGEIFVFDMGKSVKIYDLACKMIQLSGRQDIEIKEIGLRPGEKLYEELLATKENTLPTVNGKIFRAKVMEMEPSTVDASFDNLRKVLLSLDEIAIVAQMKAMVPEFISNNSRFSFLDQKSNDKSNINE